MEPSDSHCKEGPLAWGPWSAMFTGFAILEERWARVVAVISGTLWALDSRLPHFPAPALQSNMNLGSAGKGFTAIKVPSPLTLDNEIIQIELTQSDKPFKSKEFYLAGDRKESQRDWKHKYRPQ